MRGDTHGGISFTVTNAGEELIPVTKYFNTGKRKKCIFACATLNLPPNLIWYKMKTFLFDPPLLRNLFFNHIRSSNCIEADKNLKLC